MSGAIYYLAPLIAFPFGFVIARIPRRRWRIWTLVLLILLPPILATGADYLTPRAGGNALSIGLLPLVFLAFPIFMGIPFAIWVAASLIGFDVGRRSSPAYIANRWRG